MSVFACCEKAAVEPVAGAETIKTRPELSNGNCMRSGAEYARAKNWHSYTRNEPATINQS